MKCGRQEVSSLKPDIETLSSRQTTNIISKRLNLSGNIFHHLIAPPVYFSEVN